MFDYNALKSLPSFDAIPCGAFHVARGIILHIAFKGARAKSMALLLAGIWQNDDVPRKYIIMPWSPLYKGGIESYQDDPILEARRWILEQTTSAFLTLDIIARDLLRLKWPVKCIHYLHRGKCSNEDCGRRHERVSKRDCYHMIEVSYGIIARKKKTS